MIFDGPGRREAGAGMASGDETAWTYLPHHGRYWPLAIRPIKAHGANRFTEHQSAVELRDGT
jgi:hypothetical protein